MRTLQQLYDQMMVSRDRAPDIGAPPATTSPTVALPPPMAQPEPFARALKRARTRVLGQLAPRQLDLTGGQVRVTASGDQDLRLALDALLYDELDLELRVLVLDGTGSPAITVELLTGMSNTDAFGWVSLGTYTRWTAGNKVELVHFENMLRYVRWSVTLTGTNPAALFQIRGIGRRWS